MKLCRGRTFNFLVPVLVLDLMTVALAFRQAFYPFPWISRLNRTTRNCRQRKYFSTRAAATSQLSQLYLCSESSTYRTIANGSHFSEMEVKKSRFIGYASHVNSWDEAQSYLQSIKAAHPKARHWCFGYRCGGDPSSIEERCSDDGEPSGTAGLPILSAIKGEGLSDTVCVVVRYFGGIKLGAGGLIRSYGAAARHVLREAPVDILIPKSSLKVRVSTEHIGTLYDVSSRLGANVCGEDYEADGSLTATLTCETAVLQQLRMALNDSTRGNVGLED